MPTLRQDIRYALRSLRRSPGFTTVALVTVALGIGINTAIFSVVNGVLLRALPYPEPERLVTVWENLERRGGPATEWTGRSTFADWREHNRTFASMFAVTDWAPNITGIGRPDILAGALVSPAFFSVLGVTPALGRGFLPAEEIPGNARVAVLSHELWQRRFGGDPAILGRSLLLNGEPYLVVGVQPPSFRGPIVSPAEIWAVLPIDRSRDDRGNYFLRVVGRLAPGVTRETALADMNRVAAAIALEHPLDYRDVGITLTPLQDTVVGPVRTPLLILLGAVGLILLIACANVANLLLARASVRRRELAIRAALGAGRSRLIRQLLTESVLLALAGGLIGLALGVWGTDVLVRISPTGMPRTDEIGLHPAVFVFAAAASVATGMLFGLAPALGWSRSEAMRGLSARGTPAEGGARLRGALVVVELAMGMAVLAAAGLLLRSFAELKRVDPGFRAENVLSARLVFPAARYPDPAAIPPFLHQLEERLSALPGVRSVGAVSVLPLSGLVHDVNFAIEGRLPPPGEEPAADERRATPRFFQAMGIPLLRGRLFAETDRDAAAPVALVSESMAQRYFAEQDPIGKRIKVGGVRDPESPWWTIVGVVGSVRSRAVDRVPEPEIYQAAAQRPGRGWSVVVRTDRDPTALGPALRETVWALDRAMAISQLATLEELFASSVAPQRFMSWLLGVFAALAVLLGAIGIYGVMAFMVNRRSREIGIRMALGARPGDVLRAVMRRGLALTVAGVMLGFGGALAASRALTGILFEVSPTDPATLASVAALLAGSALFACYWPARRATRVDPMVTLRAE